MLAAPAAVSASPLDTTDSDEDGLTDALELILNLDPYSADSDGDAYGDLEEIARQTDPLEYQEVPADPEVSVGMVGNVVDGVVRLIVPVYLPNGSTAGIDLRIGVSVFGAKLELPPEVYLPLSTISLAGANAPSDQIVVLNLGVPKSLLVGLGGASFFATTKPPGATHPTAAAVLDLKAVGGVMGMLAPVNPSGYGGGGGATIDVLYRPIDEPQDVPASWTSGKLCSQQTAPQGSVGGVLIYQITASDCVEADGQCSPGCEGMTGQLIDVLDPQGLIGG